MAIMMGNLYAALRGANVSEEQAQKAAEEVAAFDGRIGDIRNEVQGVRSELIALGGRVTLLTWMIGVNSALVLTMLGIMLRQ